MNISRSSQSLPLTPAGTASPCCRQMEGTRQSRFVNLMEKLETGLTIKTREGDVVTLSSRQSGQLSASRTDSHSVIQERHAPLSGYGNRGVAATPTRTASAVAHHRQVALHTEEAFSFTVNGDLNEQELADIDAIILGIDRIIQEMAEGDMAGAMDQAMEMGSFDSIAGYTADIRMERAYQYEEQAGRYAASSSPLNGPTRPYPGIPAGGPKDAGAGSTNGPIPPSRTVDKGTSLMERMMAFLKEQEELLLIKSASGLDGLLEHHLTHPLTDDAAGQSMMATQLTDARDQVTRMMDEIQASAFDHRLGLDQQV